MTSPAVPGFQGAANTQQPVPVQQPPPPAIKEEEAPPPVTRASTHLGTVSVGAPTGAPSVPAITVTPPPGEGPIDATTTVSPNAAQPAVASDHQAVEKGVKPGPSEIVVHTPSIDDLIENLDSESLVLRLQDMASSGKVMNNLDDIHKIIDYFEENGGSKQGHISDNIHVYRGAKEQVFNELSDFFGPDLETALSELAKNPNAQLPEWKEMDKSAYIKIGNFVNEHAGTLENLVRGNFLEKLNPQGASDLERRMVTTVASAKRMTATAAVAAPPKKARSQTTTQAGELVSTRLRSGADAKLRLGTSGELQVVERKSSFLGKLFGRTGASEEAKDAVAQVLDQLESLNPQENAAEIGQLRDYLKNDKWVQGVFKHHSALAERFNDINNNLNNNLLQTLNQKYEQLNAAIGDQKRFYPLPGQPAYTEMKEVQNLVAELDRDTHFQEWLANQGDARGDFKNIKLRLMGLVPKPNESGAIRVALDPPAWKETLQTDILQNYRWKWNTDTFFTHLQNEITPLAKEGVLTDEICNQVINLCNKWLGDENIHRNEFNGIVKFLNSPLVANDPRFNSLRQSVAEKLQLSHWSMPEITEAVTQFNQINELDVSLKKEQNKTRIEARDALDDNPFNNPTITSYTTTLREALKNESSANSLLEDLSNEMIGRNAEILSQVTNEELERLAWAEPQIEHLSPNVKAFIDTNSQNGFLIQTTILSCETPAERAKMIEFYIKLAEKCYQMKDYSSTFLILNTVSTTNIQRLTNTWSLVSKDARQTLDNFGNLLSMSQNFENYKNEISGLIKSGTPFIPHIGPFLTRLTNEKEKFNDSIERYEVVNLQSQTILAGKEYKFTRQPVQTPALNHADTVQQTPTFIAKKSGDKDTDDFLNKMSRQRQPPAARRPTTPTSSG